MCVNSDWDTVAVQAQFPFPEIPATLTEAEARKAFLLTHYWDQFDFTDTTLVNNRDVTEQGFVNFIALLLDGTASEELVRESLKNWCKGFVGKDHARKVLTQTADSYLFNPNSPFYNEALYGLYLETMLDVLPQTDAVRSSYQFKLELVRRNNPGDRATDFTYYLPDGTRCTLGTTPTKNDRLLLVFYDPECESCHEVLQQMAADASLAEAVQSGQLSVLAVYTEVKTGALYDLKAMPSLYLLDGSKTVLLKDAAYEKIRTTLAF